MSKLAVSRAVVLLAVLVIGCVDSDQESPPVVCPAGLIEGSLGSDPQGGTAIASAGALTPLVWPPGYVIVQPEGGRIDIQDEKGTVVARTGEYVRLQGGFDEEGRWWVCGEPTERR